MAKAHGGRFTATLFRYPGKSGWHFAPVPDRLAPPVTHGDRVLVELRYSL